MQKLYPLLLALLLCHSLAFSQNSAENSPQRKNRFHLGFHYVYLNYDMKIQSLKSSSVWSGQNLGTNELANDELDEINSFSQIDKEIQGPCFEAGIQLSGLKGETIFLEFNFMVGIVVKDFETFNSKTESTDMQINSKNFNPWIGMGVVAKYRLNDKWSIKLNPIVNYSWGESDDIKDNLYPIVNDFTESRVNKSYLWYTRANLMLSFDLKKFTLSAGPGIYYLYNKHEYTIDRLDSDEQQIYMDKINSTFVSNNIIDACLAANWNISKDLLFTASLSAATDLFVSAGFCYSL